MAAGVRSSVLIRHTRRKLSFRPYARLQRRIRLWRRTVESPTERWRRLEQLRALLAANAYQCGRYFDAVIDELWPDLGRPA
jgi:hypothetical protein